MDSIDLDIIPEPVIFAGADKSVCANSTVSVNDATAYNVGSITWSSSGTGSFLNGSSISTTYIPSAADTAAGTVDLYMNVTVYPHVQALQTHLRLQSYQNHLLMLVPIRLFVQTALFQLVVRLQEIIALLHGDHQVVVVSQVLPA